MALADYSVNKDLEEFSLKTIDAVGPNNPWAKSVGDMNNDGYLDIVIGGHRPPKLSLKDRILRRVGLYEKGSSKKGELVWYEYPDWSRHTISESFSIRTDMEVADINLDGINDLIITSNEGVFWLEGPDWKEHKIDSLKMHDVEIADIDKNGLQDVVTRNQSLFGYENGNEVIVYLQSYPDQWDKQIIPVRHGEGLKVYDMDHDDFPDIIVNGDWLKNPGLGILGSEWNRVDYIGAQWIWEDVYVDVGDINNDGRVDIVLSPAESAGKYYQIAWFESPEFVNSPWIKHIVDPNVEAVRHFVGIADVNRDGALDILSAEMNQSSGEDEVNIYLQSAPDRWKKTIIGMNGSHSMRVADMNNDFAPDVFGTNWHIDNYDGNYPVSLWINQNKDQIHWERHVIDSNRPGLATFIFADDLNGDTRKDIVTGAYWYQHPVDINQKWERYKIGEGANNVALVDDFDRNGSLDLLASGWFSYSQKHSLIERLGMKLGILDDTWNREDMVWGQNDGTGNFVIHDNIEKISGDFLQGVASYSSDTDKHDSILLSWHRANEGLQKLTIPSNPLQANWSWGKVAELSQDEQISSLDLDGDGLNDILLGTKWLKNIDNKKWEIMSITNTDEKPDRHKALDINLDGLVDVVIGYESVSKRGRLAWYEHPGTDDDSWKEHVIDQVIGPMSLDTSDFDNDGDMDLVVGEHNLKKPELSRLIWYENTDGKGKQWKGHLIYQGDEHHNGALTVDLDGDGDMDVISIGWSHGKVIFYENQFLK